ncbi:hypothetical protein pdam_00013667 [Pocillopora damicornis]|uniref:Uncharacterized protein n=1 Tax=Pocillopora damicornis TaxID=46731 RepID=A0A3M6UK58_POCDA|nr:hypothetical protein pdam_00013667 [Pocillopora damicornis]
MTDPLEGTPVHLRLAKKREFSEESSLRSWITKNGEQYKPSSLRGILSSVDHYLIRPECTQKLFIDPKFKLRTFSSRGRHVAYLNPQPLRQFVVEMGLLP